MKRRVLATLFGVLLIAGPASAVPVALELILLVDVSGSVNAGEYALQETGYVNAFQDAGIQAQIAAATGGIAVAYVEWSGAAQQSLEVGWTHLTDAASANAFAMAIAGASRNFAGSTATGSAIAYGANQLSLVNNGFEGLRNVIDISGDGSQNAGVDTFDAATDANDLGIIVNGLAILGSEAGLAMWYQDNIVTPGGGQLFIANSFADFGDAVSEKIGREITPIPEPGTLILIGSGLAALGVRRRRQSRG
jgi:hypothetical protein